MNKLSFLGLVGFASSFALADDDLLPANRPNFSSNATVIPFNMCILETGVTYQRLGTSLNFSGLEAGLRFGFSKNWELAISLPNYISGSPARGWTDGNFYFIRQLPGCHGWDMLVAFGSTVPTGQSDLTETAFNPHAYFSMAHDLPSGLSLTETIAVEWRHGGSMFFPSYTNGLTLSKDYGAGLGAFAELFSQFAPGQSTSQTAHFGVTFAHTKDQQADIHFGRAISAGSGTNWFIGAGYSQKIGK